MPSALSQALAATRCPPQSTNETDHPNERCGRLRARRLRSWSCDRRSCLEAPLEIPLVPILCLPCPIRSLMRRPTCAKSRGLPLCLLGHQALFPTVPQAEAISEVTFGFKRIARRSAQFSLQSSAFLFRGFPCVSTAAPPVSGSGPLLEFGDHRAHGRAAVFLGRRLRVVRGLRRPALPAPCLGDLLCHLGRARAALELGVCRVQRIPRVRVQGLEASIPQVGLKRSARAGTPCVLIIAVVGPPLLPRLLLLPEALLPGQSPLGLCPRARGRRIAGRADAAGGGEHRLVVHEQHLELRFALPGRGLLRGAGSPLAFRLSLQRRTQTASSAWPRGQDEGALPSSKECIPVGRSAGLPGEWRRRAASPSCGPASPSSSAELSSLARNALMSSSLRSSSVIAFSIAFLRPASSASHVSCTLLCVSAFVWKTGAS
mmetsp:Transcript_30792/g.73330  ORF Transcript_30792/g.73330 Transcript_30792/m.73330 type:complete len:431 (-) Transcript_30792:1376-2668(-)